MLRLYHATYRFLQEYQKLRVCVYYFARTQIVVMTVFKIIQALQLGIRTVFHIFTDYASASEPFSARVCE